MAKAIILRDQEDPAYSNTRILMLRNPVMVTLVENHVIGLNFIDTYLVSLYPAFTEWTGLGHSGVVLAIGDGVMKLKLVIKLLTGGPLVIFFKEIFKST